MSQQFNMSGPIDISQAIVDDPFWSVEQELVRTAVLPYQWRALNDQVPGASSSYCMHNFRAAAALNERLNGQEGSGDFQPPTYTNRGFHCLPKDPDHPDPDKFYGYVFQDTDFSKWVEAVGCSLAHHPDAESHSYAYDLPNDTAYCETCASVALIFFARRMLQLDPRSEYADVMELALYNTVLDGMAMDGKSFFCGNPLEVRPRTKLNKDPRYSYVPVVRKRWFGCACCPPNLARLVHPCRGWVHVLCAPLHRR